MSNRVHLEVMGLSMTQRTLRLGLLFIPVVICCVLVFSSLHANAEEATSGGESLLEQARAAYAKRHKVSESVRAVKLYEKAIKSQATYETCWEGSRAVAHLGSNGWTKAPREKRQGLFKKGLLWAKQATKLKSNGAHGHYYVAVLSGLNAQERTFLHQMSSARSIRLAGERAAKLNPRIECGGPVRLLGLYYRRLPAAFGGDNNVALKYLEKAVRYCPNNPNVRYELAECLHKVGQDNRARKEAQWVLDHPPSDPGDRREYRKTKANAKKLLQEL